MKDLGRNAIHSAVRGQDSTRIVGQERQYRFELGQMLDDDPQGTDLVDREWSVGEHQVQFVR